MHIKKIWFVLLSSTVLSDVHATTSLEEGLEYAISEMEKSLSPSMKKVFLDAIDTVVRIKNEEISKLEIEMQTMIEASEGSTHWIEQLADALTACRYQIKSQGNSLEEQKNLRPQDSGSMKSYREYLLKRLKQTTVSYSDLKFKFRDAIDLVETEFPGFKYRIKSMDGVRKQLENWRHFQGK